MIHMLQIIEQHKLFHLFTDKISYILNLEGDSIREIYFGARIDGADAAMLLSLAGHSAFDQDIRAEREAYGLWNGHGFHLPCLRACGETGRALFAVYSGHTVEETKDYSRLNMQLEDAGMGLCVTLSFTLHKQSGMLQREVTLTASKKIVLERAMSASVSLPAGTQSKARWLTGKWAGECRIEEGPVNIGVMKLQSKRGISGPHFNPTVALAEPSANETHGRVWFGALAYSGNWSIEVEKTIFGHTHMVAGINDFDFEMTLQPGETFTTPSFYCGFTTEGFGGMSRMMHRFIRHTILPRQAPRPVLYNSWEATFFNVRADDQMQLAEKAARIGCELFVVDDGWFGERHSDKAGLGDWFVNAEKFPNGLEALSTHVKNLGMRFGIWVEPESVNPDSDLYRAHPDWIYRYPNHEPVQLRNQYLLNMSLPQVQAYLKQALYDLLRNKDITFLKWDMNRIITEPFSVLSGAGKALWHTHVNALYALWADIRKDFAHVELETCSGGGGRVDLGILQYAEQAWPSDNTDPYTRLFIQEGFTQFYPPSVMMAWVTESPQGESWSPRPIAYRFHSAMCGGLGIGSDVTKLSDTELDAYAHWIAAYKQWRDIIQNGDCYRLLSPRDGHVSAVQYISSSGEEALVFLFANGLTTDEQIPPVRLQGLDAGARYSIDGAAGMSGATLMHAGFSTQLHGDFASRIVYLKKEC